MPAPPRMTVSRPLPMRYANPNRGPKLFRSVLNARVGVPFTPANVTTPGVPDTGLIANGSKEFILLPSTYLGNSVSQRNPALTVRRPENRQSSWIYNPRYDARDRILSEI